MDQPNYTYKKGVGWVIERFETATRIIGKYRVTVSTEPPKEGDSWCQRLEHVKHYTVHQMLDDLERNHMYAFNTDDCDRYVPRWKDGNFVSENATPMKLIVERVAPKEEPLQWLFTAQWNI